MQVLLLSWLGFAVASFAFVFAIGGFVFRKQFIDAYAEYKAIKLSSQSLGFVKTTEVFNEGPSPVKIMIIDGESPLNTMFTEIQATAAPLFSRTFDGESPLDTMFTEIQVRAAQSFLRTNVYDLSKRQMGAFVSSLGESFQFNGRAQHQRVLEPA